MKKIVKNKARLNYLVDVIIGIGLLAAAISGIILFFAGSSGYQGGRNNAFLNSTLLFSRFAWKEIHNWSGFIMFAGIIGHFILHWNWIVCMTKNLFRKKNQKINVGTECAVQ